MFSSFLTLTYLDPLLRKLCSGIFGFSEFCLLIKKCCFPLLSCSSGTSLGTALLWCPAVQCPECSYPNDQDFSFCQRCGYRRFSQSQQSVNSKIQLDLPSINNRLQSIQALRASKPYEKQISALQKELENFLFSIPLSKSLSSAAPQDLVRFLIYKDRKGKTKVHKPTCPLFRSHTKERCQCPARLAAGTVDSLIGKLHSIFNNASLVPRFSKPVHANFSRQVVEIVSAPQPSSLSFLCHCSPESLHFC